MKKKKKASKERKKRKKRKKNSQEERKKIKERNAGRTRGYWGGGGQERNVRVVGLGWKGWGGGRERNERICKIPSSICLTSDCGHNKWNGVLYPARDSKTKAYCQGFRRSFVLRNIITVPRALPDLDPWFQFYDLYGQGSRKSSFFFGFRFCSVTRGCIQERGNPNEIQKNKATTPCMMHMWPLADENKNMLLVVSSKFFAWLCDKILVDWRKTFIYGYHTLPLQSCCERILL